MSSTGRHEEPIQTIPKRVVGLLRREVVIGVAASRNASACWTKETVFTWGTNTGQLGRVFFPPSCTSSCLLSFDFKGYDKSAQPVQVFPRPVTKFSNIVIDISMTVRDTLLI